MVNCQPYQCEPCRKRLPQMTCLHEQCVICGEQASHSSATEPKGYCCACIGDCDYYE